MTLPMHRIIPVPLRFRFTDPDDVAKYGDQWTVYDETALVRLPARQLAEFEQTIGMSIKRMTVLLRDEYVGPTLAAMWIARRLAGFEEEFADFNPAVILTTWEPAPLGEPEGDDADPPASASSGPTATSE